MASGDIDDRRPTVDDRNSAVVGRPSSVVQTQDYNVLTPERVSLQFEVAGLGSRGAAALLDTLIQAVAWIALLIVPAVLFTRFPPADGEGTIVVIGIILAFLGGFFLLWGYYMLFEIVWSGQTPGKRALGIRVIRENGYPIRPADAVIRNLVRIIDGPPAGAVIGALVMLFNERARRIGDFAAGTLVVREGRRTRLEELPGLASPMTPVTIPASALTSSGAPPSAAEGAALTLGAEDATLLRDFLVRRTLMDEEPRARLARRLADHLTARYGLTPPPTGRAEAFLETLAG